MSFRVRMSHTLSVESLLPLTNMRESDDHATCARVCACVGRARGRGDGGIEQARIHARVHTAAQARTWYTGPTSYVAMLIP